MSDINFVEVDSSVISDALIKAFEDETGETFYPGDERRMFLLNFLQVLVAAYSKINDTGLQNLLRYAKGVILDAICEDFFSTERLPATKASCTVRFTLSGAQAVDIVVPAGTKVTPDGKLFYETAAQLTIIAGQTTGDVQVNAMDAGASYNDFTPGQINKLVDQIPYVLSVSNTTSTAGGSDQESDDAYRSRARLALESFSVAGPSGAYEYYAKSADSSIIDVSISSPSAGVVKVVPLCAGGEIPSEGILDLVLAAVSAKDRRPLTDNVQVDAPTEVTYNLNLTYYIATERKAEESTIRAAIENVGGSIDQYVEWQYSKLGRAENPDELRRRMLEVGAFRVEITTPTYTAIDPDEFANIGTRTVTYGGLI